MIRSILRAALTNWSAWDGPWYEKVRLAGRNNLHKLRHRSSCCGRHGQPGC